MPVVISGVVRLTKEDSRDGESRRTLRYLMASERLDDLMKMLPMLNGRALHSELRAFYKCRTPYHMFENENLPEPNDQTFRELLMELFESWVDTVEGRRRTHELVCQMLANGF